MDLCYTIYEYVFGNPVTRVYITESYVVDMLPIRLCKWAAPIFQQLQQMREGGRAPFSQTRNIMGMGVGNKYLEKERERKREIAYVAFMVYSF